MIISPHLLSEEITLVFGLHREITFLVGSKAVADIVENTWWGIIAKKKKKKI